MSFNAIRENKILAKIFESTVSLGSNSCRCFCVELVTLLLLHQHSVDSFSCSGPSGILGSDGKHNTA